MLWSLNTVSLAGRRSPRLDQVTVEIPAGISAVMGQSGAGKTSLLNLLVGFERVSRGRVECQIPDFADRLALFWGPPQQGLWPHLTVREHLTTIVPSRILSGRTSIDIDELLLKFDLLTLASARPDSLSLGERSRLNVVRALASNAQVLVLDEPLTNVDAARSRQCWDVIRAHCATTGTSLVFSTHSPETVLREAEHVICLAEGRLLFAGDVRELYERPASHALATVMGPCNWLTPSEMDQWFPDFRWPVRTGKDEAKDMPETLNNVPIQFTSESTGFRPPVCLRPEQLLVEATLVSPLTVGESVFTGTSGEIELHDERNETTRRFVHRPVGRIRFQRGDRVILKILLLLWMVCFSGCSQDASPPLSVKAESSWRMPPDGARVPAPRGMTVSPDDEYLVLDNAGRVLVFDQNGDLQRKWWMPEYSVGKAEGICVLKDGRIAVADTHYHRIVFFNHQGEFTGMFGQKGNEPGDFVYPVKIRQDPDEFLYVCEYGENDRVQKFRPDGTFVLQFGGPGTEPGQFQRPCGIAWYDHRLYVVDAFNNRIQVFTDDGKLIAILGESDKIAEVHYPYDITVDQHGDLLVVEYGGGRVSKFSRKGRLLGRYGTSGSGQKAAQFSTPWGLAVDRRGRIYVCDTGNRRIVELEL